MLLEVEATAGLASNIPLSCTRCNVLILKVSQGSLTFLRQKRKRPQLSLETVLLLGAWLRTGYLLLFLAQETLQGLQIQFGCAAA